MKQDNQRCGDQVEEAVSSFRYTQEGWEEDIDHGVMGKCDHIHDHEHLSDQHDKVR